MNRTAVALIALMLWACHVALGGGDSIVVFNEILYHPAADEDLLEYVELHNQLSYDVDMSDWRLRGGVDFDFPTGTIIAGHGYLVVAASPAGLEARTGCTNALGPFSDRLGNSGETLRLYNNSGRLMNEVSYRDGGDWPVAADGSGVSLAKINRDAASDVPGNWHYSATTNGTPGAANVLADLPPLGLVINELPGSTTTTWWVELRNIGSTPWAASGAVLSVNADPAREYAITNATLLPGEHLVLADTLLGFRALDDEPVFLYAAGKTDVLDARHVKGRLRGLTDEPDARWLWPNSPTPGASNTFLLRDEIVINEIMYHQRPQHDPYLESDEEWVELYNRGTTTVDLAGWELDEGIRYTFGPGTTLAAGESLVVAWDTAAMGALYPSLTNALVGPFSGGLSGRSDLIVLRDATGNPADRVRYYDGGRWPKAADGYGASLELRDPDADNAHAEAWAASDEFQQTSWRTYTNRGIAAASAVGPDGQWHEFIMGLNVAGEVLIDDVRVVESPGTAATEFIQNGSFDSDTVGQLPAKWRIIGNHRHSEVVLDPDDPGNKVLRLVATGPTEHMHNHAETTLADGQTVVNGTEYEITFRARWVRQSAQLNTRLYFNRLAKTFRLDTPTRTGTPGSQNSAFEPNVGPTHTAMSHSPAVPAAGQAVTVTATVADPEGVVAVTNWYSVNEGPWTALPMSHQGHGVYAATIPGQAASAVVQFYIESRDGVGAVSRFPAGGRESRALYKVDDGLAAVNGRHNFRIVMLPSDAAWMRTDINLMSNDPIGTTVIYEERDIFYNTGVRQKGSERHRAPDSEVGFNVAFPADNLFRGVHKSVAIDRTQGVGFGQREMLINIVMNRAGGQVSRYSDFIKVLAPLTVLTTSAELQLARYGDVYFDAQFEDGGEGSAYEYELTYYPRTTDDGTPEGNKRPNPDGVVGTALRSLGADKEQYRWVHLIKNNRDRDDYARYMEYLSIMALGNPAFNDQAGDYLDIDEWLRSMAVNVAEGCGDSFAQGGSHNARFYVRPSDQRVLFLPHDMDAFHSATRPLVNNTYLSKLMADAGNARQYYGHMYDILTTSYNTTYIQRWTDQFSALSPEQNFETFRTFIGQRHDFLMGELFKNVSTNDPQFTVTNETPVVDADSITLGGAAWIDVYEIHVAGLTDPLVPAWRSTGSGTSRQFFWEADVPLGPGENVLDVLAYDFQGNIVGSNRITVISTIAERPVQDDLRLTELMAVPAGGSDYEFIEFHNEGTNLLDLTHVCLVDGVDFCFEGCSVTTLGPGEYVVVVNDLAAFASRYDTNTIRVAGAYDGKLANDGESIAVEGRWGVPVLEFEYRDGRGWPLAADGAGHSLVPLASAIAGQPDGSLYYGRNWRASATLNGSPGEADVAPADDLLISEVEPHTDYVNPALPEYDSNDRIEIHNPGTSTVSLAGWFLSDDGDDLAKWAIPATSSIPAKGWVTFDEVSGFHSPITNGFGLDKSGERVLLSYLAGTTEDRVASAVRFKGVESDISIGRFPDEAPFWFNLAFTAGTSNTPPAPHVLIDEIMYAPDGSGDVVEEYLEVYNPLSVTAELWTAAGPWRIDGGISCTLPAGTMLPPESRLLIVSFDPVSDPATRDRFLGRYGLTNGQARLFGPYNGSLSDRGERVALERPQLGDVTGEQPSYVIVDEAIYFHQAPWPAPGAEAASALQRRRDAGAGNDPSRWYMGLVPTPGAPPSKVAIVEPPVGARLLMPVEASITAAVAVDRVAGSVEYVEFLVGATTSVGKAYAEPYEVMLTSAHIASSGLVSLTAVLHDNDGTSVSLPRHVVAYESVWSNATHRMKIHFPGYSGAERLREFPAAVTFAKGMPGYSYSQMAAPTGADLRFADATGTNIIVHEIESWDTNGESIVWVRLPELSGTNTWIWAYWGDTNATLPAYATDGSVWSEDYELVLHMADNSGRFAGDSSANAYSAAFEVWVSYAWKQSGAIGPAVKFGDDFAALLLSPDVPMGSEWTLSAWFKDLAGTGANRILAETAAGDSPAVVFAGGNALGTDQGGAAPCGYDLTASPEWRRLTVVGGNEGTRYFVNSQPVGSITNRVGGSLASIGNMSSGFGTERFARYLDEVRFSSAARTEDWIAASWLNQASNGTFVSFGTAELQKPSSEPEPDSDEDGMLDDWEEEHLGGTGADPDADADHDGMRNVEEFIAGTDPTNALSLFNVSMQWSGGQLRVVFDAEDASDYGPGYQRYYSLHSSTNLLVPSWQGVGDYTNIPGAGQSVIYTNPAGDAPRSFRGQVWLTE